MVDTSWRVHRDALAGDGGGLSLSFPTVGVHHSYASHRGEAVTRLWSIWEHSVPKMKVICNAGTHPSPVERHLLNLDGIHGEREVVNTHIAHTARCHRESCHQFCIAPALFLNKNRSFISPILNYAIYIMSDTYW